MPDRQRGAAAEGESLTDVIGPARTPASQILDRGSSATHSSHAATQRANISLIDRRSRWPRRVPYRAIEHCHSLTAHCGQDQLVSVDKESHINVEPTGREPGSEATLANGPRWAPCYVALPRQFRCWNSNTISPSSFGNGNFTLFGKFLLEHDVSFGAKYSHKVVRFPICH